MQFLPPVRYLLLSKAAATQKSMCGTETILSIKKGKVEVILSAELYWCCVTIFGGTWFKGQLGEFIVGPGAERKGKRALPSVWAV